MILDGKIGLVFVCFVVVWKKRWKGEMIYELMCVGVGYVVELFLFNCVMWVVRVGVFVIWECNF